MLRNSAIIIEYTLLSCALVVVLTIPQKVTAHSTGGSWEAKSGAYTIDLGYDPVSFVAGDSTRFDFKLWEGATTTGKAADFTQVWVRVVHENDTLLATGIWQQPLGPTTLLYEFTNPGTYGLEASFRTKDGEEIAAAQFPITVESSNNSSSHTLLFTSLLFAFGGFLGGFLVRLKRR